MHSKVLPAFIVSQNDVFRRRRLPNTPATPTPPAECGVSLLFCAGGKAPILRGLASGSNSTDLGIRASIRAKRAGRIVVTPCAAVLKHAKRKKIFVSCTWPRNQAMAGVYMQSRE